MGNRFQPRQAGSSHLRSDEQIHPRGVPSDPLADLVWGHRPQLGLQPRKGRVFGGGEVPVLHERERECARRASRIVVLAHPSGGALWSRLPDLQPRPVVTEPIDALPPRRQRRRPVGTPQSFDAYLGASWSKALCVGPVREGFDHVLESIVHRSRTNGRPRPDRPPVGFRQDSATGLAMRINASPSEPRRRREWSQATATRGER
jgi:hypothetical protein